MGEVICLYGWNEKKARQLCSWVEKNPQRHLLFLEDNPFNVNQVYLHSRIRCIFIFPENEREIFEQIAWEFLYLPFFFEDENHPLIRRFLRIQAEINFRFFDFSDQGEKLLKNFRANLSRPTFLAKSLYKKFKDFPAIICGGGQSLVAARHKVERFQDKALILGCGAGAKQLNEMGIKAHFVAHVDPSCLHTFSSSSVPIFYQLRTDCQVTSQYEASPRFLVEGAGHLPLERFLQNDLGLTEVFEGGWSVGTVGVALAVLMGCNPIILAGIDFFENKPSPGTGSPFVKNRYGENRVSQTDWVLAAEWLDQFALKYPNIQWGTLASDGIKFSSIPFVKLEEELFPPGMTFRIQRLIEQHSSPLLKSPVWQEIFSSIQRCQAYCFKLLKEMEVIFPKNPLESGICALIEDDLSQEVAYQQLLEPLWNCWRHVIRRHNTEGEKGLYLNRILFFQSSCDKFHAS